ncbi:multiple epidermal growth factor-like domains protein 10 isoform X1 [Ostrea edulis]|uniref:multiple epidermal growth factor-like domains protein 10 isoform X1 n=1 Tax=Ostrea edulis TaxID=37623 RepID=UPI0024AFB498|nr:multiple epidermal growth factor-like domains protein 10 isoform X1 [Ostrea edulis]
MACLRLVLFCVFFLKSLCSKADDNLLSGLQPIMVLDGKKETIDGLEKTIDGKNWTCVKFKYFKVATWYLELSAMQNVFKINVLHNVYGCPSGFFGRNCSEVCSGNCLHKSTCNVTTGYCDDGCAPGWRGADCSEGCPENTYGSDCKNKCGHCKDGAENCDRETGVCIAGCNDGYFGDKCHSNDAGNITIGDACSLKQESEDDMTVYILLAALVVSVLVNVFLGIMFIARFRVKPKKEICDNPSPVYVNVVDENLEGIPTQRRPQYDQTNMQYETLGTPANALQHYDTLKS